MASDGKKLLLRNVARWDVDVDACVAVLGLFFVSVMYTYPDTDWPDRTVASTRARVL